MARIKKKIIQRQPGINSILTSPDGKGYCGTGFAATLLGLSIATIHKLVAKKELKGWTTHGGHRKIAMASLEEYRRKINPASYQKQCTSESFRVLLIDDNAVTRQMVLEYFDNAPLPINCISMSSSMEALMRIVNIKPDLLIADLNMHGVNSFELLSLLRKNPQFDRMKILLFTTMTKSEIQEMGRLPRGSFCVSKPTYISWLNGFFAGYMSDINREGQY